MRTLLKNDITLCRDNGSCVKFHITSHIGSGASCVVYRAICDDNTEHLLKEYYPRHLDLERDLNDTLIIPEHKKESFEIGLQRFRDSNERQKKVRLSEELKNFTSNVQGYFYGNGTEYIDMTVSAGCTYERVERESLYDLLRRMKVLSQVIAVYHKQGLLHLDIKPENIYVRPKTETVEDVMLFDFDSVIEENRKMEYAALSYTKSWAASEQMLCKRESICKATDLFAIGEIIFFRIFGRHSTSMERRSFAKYEFDHNAEIFRNVNPKVFPLLKEILRYTICNVVEKRYQSAEELISVLDEALSLANPKEHFLISNLPTPKSFFIGRDQEIEDIHRKLQENNILFLHGIGGIGKSELAKQYAQKYCDAYDTIVFVPYVTDMISMIADDKSVPISNFEFTKGEEVEKYFERKLLKIKELISKNKERILIIVDNFDTDKDSNTKILFDLGCKVLVTTRVTFARYGYSQVKIEPFDDISMARRIFDHYYQTSSAEENVDIDEIIGLVQGHTMAVELIAKQIEAEWSTAREIKDKLKFGGLSTIGDANVDNEKDGEISSDNAYGHIKALFDLSIFNKVDNEHELYVLANLSLIPYTGIDRKLFAEWCELDQYGGKNCVNNLIKRGWIRNNENMISLHPLIADISSELIITNPDWARLLYISCELYLSCECNRPIIPGISTIATDNYFLPFFIADKSVMLDIQSIELAELLSVSYWRKLSKKRIKKNNEDVYRSSHDRHRKALVFYRHAIKIFKAENYICLELAYAYKHLALLLEGYKYEQSLQYILEAQLVLIAMIKRQPSKLLLQILIEMVELMNDMKDLHQRKFEKRADIEFNLEGTDIPCSIFYYNGKLRD